MKALLCSPYLWLFFSLGFALCISAFVKALQLMDKIEVRDEFNARRSLYFFPRLIRRLFPIKYWKKFHYLLGATAALPIFFFAIFLLESYSHFFSYLELSSRFSSFAFLLLTGFIATCLVLLIDSLVQMITSISPVRILRLSTPVVSIAGLLFFPLTFVLLKIYSLSGNRYFNRYQKDPSTREKNTIFELLHESDLSEYFLSEEKKLIGAVTSLKHKKAKEVMIPRVDVIALDQENTLEKAISFFIKHGHSRIPVFSNSIDNITGILYFKDVVSFMVTNKDQSADQTAIKALMRPPFFTPESKKIHVLLHEMRGKKVHLALVVDEYGGTEGIVTIEDILEELVGEIADEHDVAVPTKVLKKVGSDQGFIVDGKMTILDLEKQLGLTLPHQNNYDTIGGYIFYSVGSIPKKGWKMHSDAFDLEVLSSNERCIEKILISPRLRPPS